MDAALATGRVTVSTGQVTLVMPASANRNATFELSNPGSDATYTIENDPAQTWLGVTPASGSIKAGASVTLRVTASSAGLSPGDVRTGVLLVRSSSGRAPVVPVSVVVVVPKVQIAVETGGGKNVVDAAGDTWTADREYTPGGYGYVGGGKAKTSPKDVKGTSEQGLFRSSREGMQAYRFDRLPDGVYTVELGFAETRHKKAGKRVFDVAVAGVPVIEGLDLAKEAGENTAVTRQYTVKVTGGKLDVVFRPHKGDPIVNAIRVTERPDKAGA